MSYRAVVRRDPVSPADESHPVEIEVDSDTRIGDIIVTIATELVPRVSASVAWSVRVVDRPVILRSESGAPRGISRESGVSRPLAMIIVPRGETPQIIRMSAGLGPRQGLVNVLTPSEDGTFAFTVSYLEDGKPTALDEYRSWLDR